MSTGLPSNSLNLKMKLPASHLTVEKNRLLDRIAAIRDSGMVAPAYCFLTPINTTSKAGKTYEYARLVTQKRSTDKQKGKQLGRWGGEEHRRWERAISRRDAILELERQLTMLTELIDRQQQYANLVERSFDEPGCDQKTAPITGK